MVGIGAGLPLVLAGVTLAGCDEERPAPRGPIPTPRIVDLPASAAGGACQLLDYPTIEETTGTLFDVAAASTHRDSHSCVLRTETAEQPELAFSVTATKADVEAFKAEMTPDGGKAVSGLGKAAYRLTLAPGKGYGAGVEVGWLSGDGRVLNLRYVFAAGEDRAAADAFAGKVVALAKKLDTSSL